MKAPRFQQSQIVGAERSHSDQVGEQMGERLVFLASVLAGQGL